MDRVERGDYKYNPDAGEYQSTKRKYYTVVVEGMDIGLRFINEYDAQLSANNYGADAHVGYVVEGKL